MADEVVAGGEASKILGYRAMREYGKIGAYLAGMVLSQ